MVQPTNSKDGTAYEKNLETYEQMFNALADRTRLKIINEISKSTNKQLCVCDLEEMLDLKQSKISYHLKKLVDADILSTEKHGTWNYYRVNESHLQGTLSEDTCSTIL
ncbi:ArsR/SmtB family transcription factor [Salinicoccus bachuensis]|uniref:ArsR/SmtB family transcription factor n=1 Tax=Salinicoccus bachuensis TaxID=3136731 RepID=A0ABZ3CL48_9STAP